MPFLSILTNDLDTYKKEIAKLEEEIEKRDDRDKSSEFIR